MQKIEKSKFYGRHRNNVVFAGSYQYFWGFLIRLPHMAEFNQSHIHIYCLLTLMTNFLSLNEMFLISDQGNPILGVRRSSRS